MAFVDLGTDVHAGIVRVDTTGGTGCVIGWCSFVRKSLDPWTLCAESLHYARLCGRICRPYSRQTCESQEGTAHIQLRSVSESSASSETPLTLPDLLSRATTRLERNQSEVEARYIKGSVAGTGQGWVL